MKPHTLLATAVLGFAALTELDATITITRQPTIQWVSLGAHVTNKVTLTSTAPPINYQWHGPAGPLLAGETNLSSATLSLVLSIIQTNQAGGYYVILSDTNSGPVQSATATITVDPTFIKITEGPIVTDLEPSISPTCWDYDGDGHLDLYVLNNACWHGCPATNSLYRNVGNGTFEKVTNILSTRVARYSTAAVADYDHDGDEDLYVLRNTYPIHDPSRYPPDELYRNEGNGMFAPVTGQPWRLDLDTSNDCSWSDSDRDGLLDVFLANVAETDPECLYRQRVDGSFVKMTAAQVGSIVGVNLSSDACMWADYDNDGDPDLWLSSRDGRARLHQNNGSGFFAAATNAGSVTTLTANCIGVWGDYDNDGWMDLFAASYPWPPVTTAINALHRNLQGSSFTNVATAAGVALANNAWASAWGDYDNDGWLDLFVANFENGTNLFYRNLGDGTFEKLDVGSPIRDGGLRSAVAWVDYDNDGLLDLFITCGNGTALPNHLYRNNALAIGNANHWLKIKLKGQASNRSGIGAKVRVKATIGGKEVWQVREISGNSGYQGGYGLAAHFGLGDAAKADLVRVEWPSGNVQELTDVAAGQAGQAALTITEQVFITPVRPSASLGGTVTLTSSRSGATAWQWYHDGVAMDGQAGQTLALSNVTTNAAGRYSVIVTTATGTFTNHVYLLVDAQFEQITTGDVVSDGMRANQGAWGDYDADGHPDLAVTGGYWDTSGAINSALYHNDGAGRLVKVPDSPLSASRDRACYLAWADFENDGDLDLVTGVQESALTALYLNQGNGQFIKQRTSTDWIANGVAVRGSTLGCGDYDADGLLDLMVINWVAGGGPSGPDALLHNLGGGRFEVMTNSALALRATSEETVAWVDYDGDGDLDFSSVESDSTQLRRLFRNLGDGSFEPVNDSPFWGEKLNYWGHVWADFDNDGDFDVIVCASGANASRDAIFLNDGQGNLARADLTALGLAADFGSLPALGDYDNDGHLDLYCSGAEGRRNRLFHNRGNGTFEEVLIGAIPNFSGPSALGGWADYDGDGYLDLFVPNDSQQNDLLYRNNHREHLAQMGKTNHWLQINLRGTKSNRSGIGAKVRVTANIGSNEVDQLRQIGGLTCAPELFAHFGLGDATEATTVRIEWPSGVIEEFSNLARDQFYTIVEPSLRGQVKPNGEFELAATASTNRVCMLDVSNDLSNWITLTNFTGQGETPVRVTDPEAPGQSQRFYRMK